MRWALASLVLASSFPLAPFAFAGDSSALLPAAGGRPAMAVEIGKTAILARMCGAPGACSAHDGPEIAPIPSGLTATPSIRVVTLVGGKRVALVEADGAAKGQTWVVIVAPSATDPVVLWQGMTGATQGEQGEGRTKTLVVEDGPRGARVVIGDRYENATICGRPTVLGAREIDPASMTLVKGSGVQALSSEERAQATKIRASRIEGDRPPAAAPLLRATTASSAVDKKLAALTDSDAETAWSEDRPGIGAGEFVAMSSSEDVGIDWLELRVRPPQAEIPGGAAPRTFYLATPDHLFEVTMPEDAWQKAGARYEVKLPEALRTACLSVVLGEAYARGDAKDTRVTIAEIAAHTAFDGGSVESLVGALAGGGERSKAAAALLGRAANGAVAAVIAGYPKLDDAGKELARGVVDAAPCADQVPFFARLMVPRDEKGRVRAIGPTDGEAIHAGDRVRRCGRSAAPALAKLVADSDTGLRLSAARELAIAAPNEAVPPILDAVATAPERTRAALRAALAQAARSGRAEAALAAEFEAGRFAGRSEMARIDLLRAVGPALAGVPGGPAAFASMAVPGAPFRTRFLLQAPAAELAQRGDRTAEAYLRAGLRSDEDAHVRARAAEVAAPVPALRGDLAAAIGDPDDRVRQAAALAIGRAAAADPAAGAPAEKALVERLAGDPWTFVRLAAASALGAMPAGVTSDRALAAALTDASPDVLGGVLDALGAHRAAAYRDPIHAIAVATEQPAEVRARAIVALGRTCDARWLDEWTRLALRLAEPQGDGDARLGAAALEALGAVHPADLERRLAPLTGEKGPRGVKEVVLSAIAAPGDCR